MERNEFTTDELSETYLDIQTKINKVNKLIQRRQRFCPVTVTVPSPSRHQVF